MSVRDCRTSGLGLPSIGGSEKIWPMFTRMVPVGFTARIQWPHALASDYRHGQQRRSRFEGQTGDARQRPVHRAVIPSAFREYDKGLIARESVQSPAIGAYIAAASIQGEGSIYPEEPPHDRVDEDAVLCEEPYTPRKACREQRRVQVALVIGYDDQSTHRRNVSPLPSPCSRRRA